MRDDFVPGAGVFWKALDSVLPTARRLRAERRAPGSPNPVLPDFLDTHFDETLARLANGEIDETWWKRLWSRFGHKVMAPPDFLRRPRVQLWFQDQSTRKGLKQVARAHVYGLADNPAVSVQLRQSYAKHSGDSPEVVKDQVDTVVATLVAGFMASIQPDHQPSVAFVNQVLVESRSQHEELKSLVEDQIADNIPPGFVEFCEHQVQEALTRIRQRCDVVPDKARDEVQLLVRRVEEDLKHAGRAVKAEVLYWAARLHASEAETLDQAQNYLEELRELEPGRDTTIVDACILEKEGDPDAALRLLRDLDSPDGRATFFAVLVRHKGASESLEWFKTQEPGSEPGLLTGLGWFNVLLSFAKSDDWEEAHSLLTELVDDVVRKENPDLLYLEGVVNVALTLPTEIRADALSMNVFHPGKAPLETSKAGGHRRRAVECFERVVETLDEVLPERVVGAKAWLLWLRLTAPELEIRNKARREVQQRLEDHDIYVLHVARTFNISYDSAPFRKHLEQLARLGGLTEEQKQALFFLTEKDHEEGAIEPSEFVKFLESDELQLSEALPKCAVVQAKIEALSRSGRTREAKKMLEDSGDLLEASDRDVLRVIIDQCEGKSPRPGLEEIYEKQNSLISLQHLTNYLYSVQDWAALRPLQQELFNRQATCENALRLIISMEHAPNTNPEDILRFRQKQSELIEGNSELLLATASALFSAGHLSEAKTLTDQLWSRPGVQKQERLAALQLDMNIALQGGDWERFPSIVERVWSERNELEASLLLQLASLSAETETSLNRSLELIQLAVEKGKDDPEILVGAVSLVYRLGKERDPQFPTNEWLAQAHELSTSDGPVKLVDLKTISDELLPAQRERKENLEELLMKGQLPLSLVASSLNIPLPWLLQKIPQSNSDEQDGRRRVMVPIVSGARHPVKIESDWVVGLDVSSIFVLFHLGLLKQALDALPKVSLAPDTMVMLLNNRARVKFHQPTLAEDASDIRKLVDQQRLHVEKDLPTPMAELVEEVGHSLGQLLMAAEKSKGFVVTSRPVRKVGSFMREPAKLGSYDDLVLSTVDFERLLFETGKLDDERHRHAKAYLQLVDRGTDKDLDAEILESPIYLDDLGMTYLQRAGLLPVLTGMGLDLRVHEDLFHEQAAILSAKDEGKRIVEAIDEIRQMLHAALEEGKVAFVPRRKPPEEDRQLLQIVPTLAQLLLSDSAYDALYIDDRLANSKPWTGQSKRIICTLDVLRYMEDEGMLSANERFDALHRLRAGGFALVPVEAEELLERLRSVRWRGDGTFVEGSELRVIRQYLARLRSLGMLQSSTEGFYLGQVQRASVAVIYQLWMDEELPVDNARELSQWIWHYVAPSPLDWVRGAQVSTSDGELPPVEAFTHHLAFFTKIAWGLSGQRKMAFSNWLEQEIIGPLLPTDAAIVDQAADIIGRDIEDWSEHLAEETMDGDAS